METFMHLWDLPEKEVYVKFDSNFAKEFFGIFIKNFDYKAIMKELGYKTITMIWYYKMNRSSYPLSIVTKVSELVQTIDRRFSLVNAEKHVKVLSAKKKVIGGMLGNPIFDPKFPFFLNEAVARLISHIHCDGDVRHSGGLRYTNTSYSLVQSFISDLKTLGDVQFKLRVDDDAYRVYAPKIVKLILDKLGLDDKKFNFTLNTTNENKMAFIQAAFDDEGTVDIQGHHISIISSNVQLLQILRELLNQLGIVTSEIKPNGKTTWWFIITGFKNFIKFYCMINFQHPEKRNKFQKLLDFYRGKKVRPLMGETNRKIFSALEERPMTAFELSKKLNLNLGSLNSQLHRVALSNKFFGVDRINGSIVWSTKNNGRKYARLFSHSKFSIALLKILEKPQRIKEIANVFDRDFTSVLYHLRKLREKGLVVSKRCGKNIFWIKTNP